MNIDIFFVPAFSLFVYWHVQFYCCHSETKKGVNPDWPSRSWRRIRHWLFPSPSFSLDSLKHTDSRGSLLHWNNIDQYLSLLSRLTTDPTPPVWPVHPPKWQACMWLYKKTVKCTAMYCSCLLVRVFTCKHYQENGSENAKQALRQTPPAGPRPPAHTHIDQTGHSESDTSFFFGFKSWGQGLLPCPRDPAERSHSQTHWPSEVAGVRRGLGAVEEAERKVRRGMVLDERGQMCSEHTSKWSASIPIGKYWVG